MIRKFVIILVCLFAVCIVLGLSPNVSHEDFQLVGEYFSADTSHVLAEIELFSTLGTWYSFTSLDYNVVLYQTDNYSDLTYVFLPPDEAIGYPGQITLIIDQGDVDLGIANDLRRIGNTLVHDYIPEIPEDPNTLQILDFIGNIVSTIWYYMRFFAGILYSIVVIVLHSLPVSLQLIRALLFILGFINTLPV